MLTPQGSAAQGHLLLVTVMCAVGLRVAMTQGRVDVCQEMGAGSRGSKPCERGTLCLQAHTIVITTLSSTELHVQDHRTEGCVCLHRGAAQEAGLGWAHSLLTVTWGDSPHVEVGTLGL